MTKAATRNKLVFESEPVIVELHNVAQQPIDPPVTMTITAPRSQWEEVRDKFGQTNQASYEFWDMVYDALRAFDNGGKVD